MACYENPVFLNIQMYILYLIDFQYFNNLFRSVKVLCYSKAQEYMSHYLRFCLFVCFAA